jgi:EAL domain-containing protein (putative c-di-GMP-specific phosphodiesterase class I)
MKESAHRLSTRERARLAPVRTLGSRRDRNAHLEGHFSLALNLLWMAFQPIVAWNERRVFGYEALVRSDESMMETPGELLEAAERLGRVHELGRAIRALVAKASAHLPEQLTVFVNLHSADLNDADLYAASAPLSCIARRVVLEVTERASLAGVENALARVMRLKSMGFRIAIDDLGAGYAGLSSFAQLEPDVAKLDISLVRDVNADLRKQTIIRSVTSLSKELGTRVVAEGVETPAERDVLVQLGSDLLQGDLFARPAEGFAQPAW